MIMKDKKDKYMNVFTKKLMIFLALLQMVSCAPSKVTSSENIETTTVTLPQQLSDIEVSRSVTITTAQKTTEVILNNLPEGAMLKTTTSFLHTSSNSKISANSALLSYTLEDSYISSVSDASSFEDVVTITFVKDDIEFKYIITLQVTVVDSDSQTPPSEINIESQHSEVLAFKRGALEQTISIANYDSNLKFLSSSFVNSAFESIEFDDETGELTMISNNTSNLQSVVSGEIKVFDLEENQIINYNVDVHYISTKYTLIGNGVATKIDFGALGFGLGDSFSQKELLSTNRHPEVDVGFIFTDQRIADPLEEDHIDLKFEAINEGTRATFSPVDLESLEAGTQPDREYEVIFTHESGEEWVIVYEVHFSVFKLDGEKTEIDQEALVQTIPDALKGVDDTQLLNSLRSHTFDLKEAYNFFNGSFAILSDFKCDLYSENDDVITNRDSAEVTLSTVNGRQFTIEPGQVSYGGGDDFFMFCFGSVLNLDTGEIFKTIDYTTYDENSFEDELDNEDYWKKNENVEKTLVWHWRK